MDELKIDEEIVIFQSKQASNTAGDSQETKQVLETATDTHTSSSAKPAQAENTPHRRDQSQTPTVTPDTDISGFVIVINYPILHQFRSVMPIGL